MRMVACCCLAGWLATLFPHTAFGESYRVLSPDGRLRVQVEVADETDKGAP